MRQLGREQLQPDGEYWREATDILFGSGRKLTYDISPILSIRFDILTLYVTKRDDGRLSSGMLHRAVW
jgi:hypothetical protein